MAERSVVLEAARHVSSARGSKSNKSKSHIPSSSSHNHQNQSSDAQGGQQCGNTMVQHSSVFLCVGAVVGNNCCLSIVVVHPAIA